MTGPLKVFGFFFFFPSKNPSGSQISKSKTVALSVHLKMYLFVHTAFLLSHFVFSQSSQGWTPLLLLRSILRALILKRLNRMTVPAKPMSNEVSNSPRRSYDNVSHPELHAHHNKAPNPTQTFCVKRRTLSARPSHRKLSSVPHFDVIFSGGRSPQAENTVFDRTDEPPPPPPPRAPSTSLTERFDAL